MDEFSKEHMVELIMKLKYLVATSWNIGPDSKGREHYEVDGELFDELIEMVRQYDEEV